jgi:hypothetical protein
MIAFKQPDNLKRMLCHAKVPKTATQRENCWACKPVINHVVCART